MHVVGRLLFRPFGRPQPAAETVGLPGLVPRGIVHLQRVVDERESVPCLVLTEPAEREARPCQHRRAHQIPGRELHVLDAPIIIQETMDAPAHLHVHRGLVNGLVQVLEDVLYPLGIGTPAAQGRVPLAMVAAQEPIDARDEVGAVHDPPAVFEHLPGILDAGDL